MTERSCATCRFSCYMECPEGPDILVCWKDADDENPILHECGAPCNQWRAMA